jgi:hypothetical protein
MDDFAPGPPKEVIYENTFITEPQGYGEVYARPESDRPKGLLWEITASFMIRLAVF